MKPKTNATPQAVEPAERTPVRSTDGSASALTFTAGDKQTLDKIAEHDKAQLKHWKQQLEEATKQVEYWTRQCDHSGAIAIRATMASWK